MSENIKAVIAELLKKLIEQEARAAAAQAEVTETKSGVNLLCKLAGETPMFPDMQAAPNGAPSMPSSTATVNGAGVTVRPDQFYNRPLSTCAREVLELRKKVGLGPASIPEIHALMKAGGYSFDSRDDENAIRGLGVSISKNTALFARLPNNLIGLVEWYGGPKRKGKSKDSTADTDVETDTGEAPTENSAPAAATEPDPLTQ